MAQMLSQAVGAATRHFAELPFSRTWHDLRSHAMRLEGASVTAFLSDDVETWLSFDYRDHEFCIHDREAVLYFSVNDAECSEADLLAVLNHFSPLLSHDLPD